MPINPNEIPLDPQDLLQRIQRTDPNLFQRVVAEAQRDELVSLFNRQEAERQQERQRDVAERHGTPMPPDLDVEDATVKSDTPIADAAKEEDTEK